jgi:hypothetical protein
VSGLLGSVLLPPRLLGGRSAGGYVVGNDLHIVLGAPGRCPTRPTLTTWIFDNSGSVLGGNDSTGRRFDEAKLAMSPIARRCRCGKELLQVLHMDRPTAGDLPPTPISRKSMSAISASLTVPSDGDGASTLGATLSRATQAVSSYPDHDAVLVIASDFELFDMDLSGLWNAIGDFPGQVHAVVLRAGPPAALLADDRITVTTIAIGDKPGAVARVLFDSLTTHRSGRRLADHTA